MARPKKKSNAGRPHAITPEVLAKLEQGFKIGLTDTECCCYADIDEATLYRYQKENPEFCEKKRKWKQNPIAKAKHTIYKNLDDAKTAQWYLERKCKEEFSTQSKLELESKGINIVVADDEHKQMLEDL
jgi:hypothetical protein